MNFCGKVVLITGGSIGIGAATALKFSKLGASLALTALNCEEFKELLPCLATNGKKPLVAACDVSNEDDNKKFLDETIKTFGQLDVLVNNAGILEFGGIENTSMRQFDTIMKTNVRGLYHLTMLAVPHLICSKGNIVNVSSVNGIRAFPGVISYNISKAIVNKFTRSVAVELASKGVRCNGVNPGVTVTDIFKRSGMNDERVKKYYKYQSTTHALQRLGKANDVAEAIAFLASDCASFTTGALLNVCGGRYAMGPK